MTNMPPSDRAELFELELELPRTRLARLAKSLVEFEARYARIRRDLHLLASPEESHAWSKKFRKSVLPFCEIIADRYPLVLFEGDVGTGKTATAEAACDRLVRELKKPAMLFKLSTQVRGVGKVGHMSTFINQAFHVIAAEAGKTKYVFLIIDEADSLAASRDTEQSHHEDKVAVNTLIQKIDDIRKFGGRFLVFLCTNRLAALDPAIVRRVSRIESFHRPDEAEREQLIRMDYDGLELSEKTIKKLVSLTGPIDHPPRPGFTYSDLRNRLLPEALGYAFPSRELHEEDFLKAAQVIIPSPAMTTEASCGISGLLGRRVHIAGSSSPQTAILLRQYAHDLVARVVRDILHAGGGLVLGVGKEPRAAGDPPNAPSLTFDWTALETAADCLRDGSCPWPTASGPPLVVVSSAKAESEIPENRRSLWNSLLTSQFLQLELIQAGARSGTILRQRQAPFGNILLTLGEEPVLSTWLISMRHDANRSSRLMHHWEQVAEMAQGGSERLAQEARANPQKFFLLQAPMATAANTYLGRIATRNGREDPMLVAKRIVELFMSLALPTAFYVRLMNDKHKDSSRVETFFRNVVDPIVTEAGFARIDLSVDATRHAFLNVAIFESLHFSSVVVVDVTGERPNCFIELGYALGCGLRVIVTAEEGTSLPSDQAAIPCHFWTHGVSERDR